MISVTSNNYDSPKRNSKFDFLAGHALIVLVDCSYSPKVRTVLYLEGQISMRIRALPFALVLRRTRNQSEGGFKSVDSEGSNLDASKRYIAKLSQPLLIELAVFFIRNKRNVAWGNVLCDLHCLRASNEARQQPHCAVASARTALARSL